MSLTINNNRPTLSRDTAAWNLRPAVSVAGTAVPAPSAGPAVIDARVERVTSKFRQQFADWAKDPEKFKAMMSRVFGPGHDAAQAEALRQRALRGDFSWLPQVRFVSDAALNGAEAGYDNASKTVLMNENLLNDPGLAASVFVEEAGHHLDNLLNTSDSKGDEGELFRRILGGENVSAAEEARIRSFQDLGTAVVDGKTVQVENFFGGLKKAFKKIGKGIGGAIKKIGKGIGGAFKKIGSFVKPVLNVFNKIAPFLSIAALAIPGIGPAVSAVMRIATPIAAALKGDFAGALGNLVPGGVGGLVGKAANLMGGLPAKALKLAQPFLDRFEQFKAKLASLPQAALGKLGEAAAPLMNEYRELTGMVNAPIDAARAALGGLKVPGLAGLPGGAELAKLPGLGLKFEQLHGKLVAQVTKPVALADAALLEFREKVNALPETAREKLRDTLLQALREAGPDAMVPDPLTRNPIQRQRAEELLRDLIGATGMTR